MADKKKDEKKIIADEDWKAQAQREKEVLSQKEQAEKIDQVEKTEQAAGQPDQQQSRRTQPLPKGDFAALISMLTTQALFALGLIQVEGQDSKEPDLDVAKYNIDMLEALEEKTKGNLTDPEHKVLENTIGQVRMAYVEIAGQQKNG